MPESTNMTFETAVQNIELRTQNMVNLQEYNLRQNINNNMNATMQNGQWTNQQYMYAYGPTGSLLSEQFFAFAPLLEKPPKVDYLAITRDIANG